MFVCLFISNGYNQICLCLNALFIFCIYNIIVFICIQILVYMFRSSDVTSYARIWIFFKFHVYYFCLHMFVCLLMSSDIIKYACIWKYFNFMYFSYYLLYNYYNILSHSVFSAGSNVALHYNFVNILIYVRTYAKICASKILA